MTGRLLGKLRGGGAVYADAAYEHAQAQKEAAAGVDLDAVFKEIIELARSRGCYVATLDLRVALRKRAGSR